MRTRPPHWSPAPPRGLGLALATALDAEGWHLVLDARRRRPAGRRRRRPAVPGPGHRPARRRRRPGTPRRAGRRRPRGGSTCWSTTPATSAPARSPGSPTCRCRPSSGCSRSTPWRRWRWSSCCCRRCAAAGGRVLQRQLRRRRRGLPRLGRLRREQGRPRPAQRGAGRRAAGPAGVRRRPGRHGHRDAPGRLPGRGHQRPARPGQRRPGAAPAGHRRRCPAAATGPRTCGHRA